MKKAYILSFWVLLLTQGCDISNTDPSVMGALDPKDSLQIVGAFVPPFANADSMYTALGAGFSESESALNWLHLNYAKVLIMTGRLGQADTLLTQMTSRPDFDTSSLANARYANLKAAIAVYKQNQEGAISHYKDAIQLFEKHKDQKSVASVNFNIANIFLSRLNYPMAYQYSAEAVEGFRSTNDTLYYPSALAVNAVSAIMVGKKEEALLAAEEAKEVSERYKNPLGMAMSSYALAEIAMDDENYDAAIAYFQDVIPLAQQLQQVTVVSAAYTSLVKAYLENKDYDLVITEGEKAIAFSERYRYEDVRYALHRYISQAYQQKGDERLSLQHMRQADAYFREEVVSNDRRVMGELLVQYEAEKKDKLLAEQKLEIRDKSLAMRNWLIAGALLLLGGISYFYHSRRSQRQRLILLQQEQENALLKAIMSGEEQERNNISNTLHDSVAAKLGAAKMSLQSIPFLTDEKRDEQLEKTAQLISNIHHDVRRIAHHLLPVTLEKEGLAAAVNEFVTEINQLNILAITIDNQLSQRFTLPKQSELVLYRIVQELINNIVKHANATTAIICLSDRNQSLEIRIADNGVGFNAEQESQGLYSIRERLRTIGGEFDIRHGQENGTVAKLVLNV